MYGRVNYLFGGTGRWKERELQMRQRELEPIRDTIRVEAYVEKMKNRAILSGSGGLFLMAMGLFYGQAGSRLPPSRDLLTHPWLFTSLRPGSLYELAPPLTIRVFQFLKSAYNF
jgi:hypothetical protein